MKNFDIDKSPKISSGFKVPEDYFNQFSAKVLHEINQEEKPVISIYKRYQVLMAAAAVLLIGLLLPFTQTDSQEINQSDIENYFAYNSNLSQYDLVRNLEENEIDNMTINYELNSDDVADFLGYNSNVEMLIND